MSSPPLRVAVTETSSYGGLLHYATQLADGLAQRGVQVDLLVSSRHELAGRTGPARRLTLFPPTVRSTAAPAGGLRYFLRRGRIAVRLAWALIRLLRQLHRGQYDAVVVQLDLGLAPCRAAARLLTRRPTGPVLAYVLHNVRPLQPPGAAADSWAPHPGVAALLTRFHVVFVHGQESLADYQRTWPPNDVVVIPHGDQSLFAAQPPPPAAGQEILFFGDWRAVKGLAVLLQAFELLSATHPDAHLTIAGNPVPAELDDAPLRAVAAQRPTAVRLIDHYVPVADVPALFAGARVVVTPYLAGYQSGVVHLAMTMARAVVTSDVGDLGEAVGHEVGGLVVPPGDAPALAAALRELLDDPQRTDAMGLAGHHRLGTRATWTAVAETVESALRQRLPQAASGTTRSATQ